MWLLIHAGIKVKPRLLKGPLATIKEAMFERSQSQMASLLLVGWRKQWAVDLFQNYSKYSILSAIPRNVDVAEGIPGVLLQYHCCCPHWCLMDTEQSTQLDWHMCSLDASFTALEGKIFIYHKLYMYSLFDEGPKRSRGAVQLKKKHLSGYKDSCYIKKKWFQL